MGTNLETFIESTQNVSSAADLKKLFMAAIGAEGYENAAFARTNNRRLVSLPWADFPRTRTTMTAELRVVNFGEHVRNRLYGRAYSQFCQSA